MLLAFPWLFLSFGLYNVIAFGRGNAAPPQEVFNETLASVPMVSGAVWTVTLGDLLIALTLIFLLIEVLKASHLPSLSIIDRVLSAVLFATCLVEFIVRREAATSVFFIITLITLLAAIGGYRPR